jgi:hypothetical protein
MILPKALALGVQLITLVATDRVPQLDVEPVCKGIAEQGGVTFRDPAVPQEKKNCIESELAVREQLVKQWSSFSADDRTHCINRNDDGRRIELHGVAHLSRNGARCASDEG